MISVIIATYGESHWEELARTRALPSVEGQAEDIVIGHDPDASIAQVRNKLARGALGDWLCFLDADDELDSSYIDVMENAASQVGYDHLLTPNVQQIIQGRRKGPRFYPEVNLEKGNWLIVGTLVSREMFDRAGGFGDYPHGFEDWSLWAKCAKLGAQVVKVRHAIYIQHVNPHSKHRQGWKDREWQVSTHQRVEDELAAWTP